MLVAKKCLGTVGIMGGVPAFLSEFAWSFAQMCVFNTEEMRTGEYIHYVRTTASLHDAARNHLVNQMRGDWLLMLDTDHQFDPDLTLRLVDRMEVTGADVMAGFYQYKMPPHSPVLYLKNKEYYAPLGSWRPAEPGGMDIFPVDACGGGCLMVKRTVFARIKEELKEEPFDRIHPLGEDMSFAKRCERLGVKIYCDARIQCHHLQVRPITIDEYQRDEVDLGKEQKVDAFALQAAG